MCVGLGEWQNDPINTKEGWSRMGPAFQTGANVACESQGFSVETMESHFGSDLDVSENSGTPKSSTLIGFSICLPSILGYPYFWNHPFKRSQKPRFSEYYFLGW